MKHLFRLAIILALATGAWAQWSSDPATNLPLADNNNGSDQVQPKVVPYGTAGGYVSWFDANPDSPPPIGYSVYYQLLNRHGYEQFHHGGLGGAPLTTRSPE